MNKVYQFLEIDNYQEISDEIYNFVLNHCDLLNGGDIAKFLFSLMDVAEMLEHTPLLQKFLQQKSLYPTVIGIVVTHPDSPSNLHVDYVDNPNTTYIRMLWPVRNCQGSRTVFYHVPAESLELVEQINGKPYYIIPIDQNWDHLVEFELTSPVVFDVSVAHEIIPAVDSTEPRISCTIGFDRALTLSNSIDAWNNF
jgi:hypothetical protein